MKRLANLQILRGIAGELGIVDHIVLAAAARDPAYVPFIGFSATIGRMGVNLFFIIGGFIMVHSTEAAKGLNPSARVRDFIGKRSTRLVPPFRRQLHQRQLHQRQPAKAGLTDARRDACHRLFLHIGNASFGTCLFHAVILGVLVSTEARLLDPAARITLILTGPILCLAIGSAIHICLGIPLTRLSGTQAVINGLKAKLPLGEVRLFWKFEFPPSKRNFKAAKKLRAFITINWAKLERFFNAPASGHMQRSHPAYVRRALGCKREPTALHCNGNHMRSVSSSCFQASILDMSLNRARRDMQFERHFFSRASLCNQSQHLKLAWC